MHVFTTHTYTYVFSLHILPRYLKPNFHTFCAISLDEMIFFSHTSNHLRLLALNPFLTLKIVSFFILGFSPPLYFIFPHILNCIFAVSKSHFPRHWIIIPTNSDLDFLQKLWYHFFHTFWTILPGILHNFQWIVHFIIFEYFRHNLFFSPALCRRPHTLWIPFPLQLFIFPHQSITLPVHWILSPPTPNHSPAHCLPSPPRWISFPRILWNIISSTLRITC